MSILSMTYAHLATDKHNWYAVRSVEDRLTSSLMRKGARRETGLKKNEKVSQIGIRASENIQIHNQKLLYNYHR